METSQPNVWALGDADGKFMYKHVANYEAEIVYYNAVEGKKIKVDYHAIPHAVFTYPEIASVGLKEKEALEKFQRDELAIGFYKYEDTAKGEAMNAKNYFVKVISQFKNKSNFRSSYYRPLCLRPNSRNYQSDVCRKKKLKLYVKFHAYSSLII